METARDQSLISNGNDLGKDTEKQEATGKINLNGLSRAVDNAMQGNGNGFPLEVFPETIQELIHSGKETVGYNKDYFSAGILSACATALGNSAQLHNGEYESKPIFWVSVIGSKGTVKTHSLKIAKKPIKEQDSQTYLKYESAMQEYEQLDKDAQGKKPKYSKFILENFTPEKLAEALQYNEKGVLIYRDELMGWINSFDQYKKGGDQQMYLELFNGNELTVDRVTKDPIRIEQTNVNILGGMQPKLLKQFAKNNRDVDGFLDRFLFVIPKNLEPRLFTGKHIPEVHIKNYEKLINNLLEAEPQTIQANASNIELYKEWQHKKVREHFNDTLERGIQAKMETYVWRLALVIEMMKQAETGIFNTNLQNESLKKAINLVEYFRRNALKVHDKIISKNPLGDLSAKQQELYKELPYEFKRADVLPLFEKIDVSKRSGDRLLQNEELFENYNTCKNLKIGYYRKKLRQ